MSSLLNQLNNNKLLIDKPVKRKKTIISNQTSQNNIQIEKPVTSHIKNDSTSNSEVRLKIFNLDRADAISQNIQPHHNTGDSPQNLKRAFTAVNNEKERFDTFFDHGAEVDIGMDFEWSGKLKNMEMKDIFDIDIGKIP